MAFYNITNHPSAKWSADQLAAASELGGEVIDLPFPNVPPLATSQDVSATADVLAAQVPDGAVGMVSGEWTLTFALATRLGDVASRCSSRAPTARSSRPWREA